tara:strand:+ start:1287 stop:1445 length:159 start_codon:yes stop_codon:yes gene_type:complete
LRRLALLTPSCGGSARTKTDADREEERVTYANDVRKKTQEQLDLNDPNQRRL